MVLVSVLTISCLPTAERIRQDLEQSAVQLSEGKVGQFMRTGRFVLHCWGVFSVQWLLNLHH